MRNGLFLVQLLIAIAVFWPPLSDLYRLTQKQSHYSHLLLIPLVSLYVFYLNRKVILASGEWSPFLGLITVGLGAAAYAAAVRGTEGVDYMSITTLELVILTWGIFILC
jgi:hypothetical protein